MMIETGRVVALESDAVWVETLRRGSCGSCAARSGCGHGLLAAAGSRPELVRARLAADGPRELALHDRVHIGIPEHSFLRGVTLLYALPLACALLGALLTSAIAGGAGASPASDLGGALGALAGLFSGLALVRWRSAGEGSAALHPVVTARL